MDSAAAEKKAEKLAESVWLRLLARGSMALVGMFIMPAFFGAYSWAKATNESFADLNLRVVVLENNTKRGREDREQFQDTTTRMLQELLKLQAATNERLARLEAQGAAMQNQIDRAQ